MRARIGALLLAAGRSRRMGPRDKLLLEVEGRPMVQRAARGLAAVPGARVAVVSSDAVAEALRGEEGLELVRNPRPDEGMASSLRLGLFALRDRVDAALVFLGDMPWVRPATVRTVLDAWKPARDLACVPTFEGRRGHPVLLAAPLFDALAALEGDVGAKKVLARIPAHVREVPVDDPGVVRDVDTPSALEGE